MMQTTAGEIFEFLKLMAPLELQMDFDNAGFLVGDRGRRVEKALLALDATSEVIDEAIDFGADMIITHHPLIWNAMKSLTTDDIMQRRVMKLVKNNISLVSMHTNLDIADGGVNDVLLSLLGADLISALDEDGCGRVGQLRADGHGALSAVLQGCAQDKRPALLRRRASGRAACRHGRRGRLKPGARV